MNMLLAIILAATVTTAPKGKIHNTDPIVTNVSFEGLAKSDEVMPIAGEYWKASTDEYGVHIRQSTEWQDSFLSIAPQYLYAYSRDVYSGNPSEYTYFYAGGMAVGDRYFRKEGISDTISFYHMYFPEIEKDETFAMRSDIERATNNIPQVVTNVVRNVQGLVYDEKLGITWKQTMYDGNLYYIAVTNANITEVK